MKLVTTHHITIKVVLFFYLSLMMNTIFSLQEMQMKTLFLTLNINVM